MDINSQQNGEQMSHRKVKMTCINNNNNIRITIYIIVWYDNNQRYFSVKNGKITRNHFLCAKKKGLKQFAHNDYTPVQTLHRLLCKLLYSCFIQ